MIHPSAILIAIGFGLVIGGLAWGWLAYKHS
jgi:hypothetical protein